MNLKLALIAGGVLFAAPAFADDQSEPAAGGTTTEAAPTTDPAAGGGMGTTTGTTAPVWGWSRSVIDRPYILGKGKIAAYGLYATTTVQFFNPVTMMNDSITADNFGVGGGYGVTDKITAGAQYNFTPSLIGDLDGDVQGTFDIYGEYEIIRDAKLNVTASADFGINLCGTRDMNGCASTTLGMNAGLGARYIVAPKMAVYTGQAYGPGPVGQHLSINFESGAIDFALPAGFMYQATPELNVTLSTKLLNIGIKDSDSTFIFADYIPVTLGALYSINPNIDVVGMFGFQDLKNDASALGFAIGARWYN